VREVNERVLGLLFCTFLSSARSAKSGTDVVEWSSASS